MQPSWGVFKAAHYHNKTSRANRRLADNTTHCATTRSLMPLCVLLLLLLLRRVMTYWPCCYGPVALDYYCCSWLALCSSWASQCTLWAAAAVAWFWCWDSCLFFEHSFPELFRGFGLSNIDSLLATRVCLTGGLESDSWGSTRLDAYSMYTALIDLRPLIACEVSWAEGSQTITSCTSHKVDNWDGSACSCQQRLIHSYK